MPARSFRKLTILLAVIGLAADQSSKYITFRWLFDGSPRGEHEVVKGWFKFTAEFDMTTPPAPAENSLHGLQTWSAPVMPRVNYGALFGLLIEHKELANRFFATITFLAVLLIIFFVSRRSIAQDGILSAALGLLLGGCLGNFYDRIVFHGVRDFLYFYRIEWPVFNVADCCLVCGAGFLMLHAFTSHSHHENPSIAAGVTPSVPTDAAKAS